MSPRVTALHTLHMLESGQITANSLGPEKRLKLAENLKEFPREIFNLADSLEVLDLSNNQLSDLPFDLGRLQQLRILFLSNNQFDHIPAVLAECPKLEMISFKSNLVKTVAENALPKLTRWLILTDNKIEKLPHSMGELIRLQKLALAGNQLSELPSSMSHCKNLELARLSANKLTTLPDWLFQLPKLSWLAFSGNAPKNESTGELAPENMIKVSTSDIQFNHQLGEGASGVIHHANWIKQPVSLQGTDSSIAVKLFKGAVTSDGYPADELSCCLKAGEHSNLIKVISKIDQTDQLGLVMELIPNTFYNLGLPPSLLTCTRDTFKTGTQFSLDSITQITLQMANTMAHLHSQGVSHGDVYAHNTMVNDEASMLFGDFGAASNLSSLPILQKEAMESIEVRAFGCLLDDLLAQSNEQKTNELYLMLTQLKNDCMQSALALRPKFSEIKELLARFVCTSPAL